MSRQCQISQRRTATGNNRPFSLKATRRQFRLNLFWKKVINPLTGKLERMRLSARAIRTLKKHTAALKNTEVEETKITKNTNKKERVKKIKLTPKQKKELAAAEQKSDPSAATTKAKSTIKTKSASKPLAKTTTKTKTTTTTKAKSKSTTSKIKPKNTKS